MTFNIYRTDIDNNDNALPGSRNKNSDDTALRRQMRASRTQRPDELKLSKPGKKQDHFSVLRAGKEFVKGIFRPIGMMIHHPFKTIAAIAVTLTVASFAPVTIPILALAGLGFGAYQTTKGIGKATGNYVTGNYQAAEKAFGDIGEGASSIAATALGVKTGGAIAGEAKTTASALKTTTTSAEKLKAVETGIEAGAKVRQGSWFNALKENVSMLTSRDGYRAIYSQLNPRAVASNTISKTKGAVQMFRKPPVADVDKAMRNAQEHLGIADKDMPTLVRNMKIEVPELGEEVDFSGQLAGFYQPESHTMHVQPDGFQFLKDAVKFKKIQTFLDKLPKPIQNYLGNAVQKKIPTDNLITHEMTHSRQALQIQKLNGAQAEEALKAAFPDFEPTELAEHLKPWKFADGNTNLSQDEIQHAQQTLVGFTKALMGNNEKFINIMEGKGMRPYIAAPAEIEARQEANQLGITQALETLDNTKSISSIKGQQAMQALRRGAVETRLNQQLETLNALEKSGASAEQIQQAEAELQAITRTFGARNATGSMLKQDQKLKTQVKMQVDIQKKVVNFKQWMRGKTGAQEIIPPEAMETESVISNPEPRLHGDTHQPPIEPSEHSGTAPGIQPEADMLSPEAENKSSTSPFDHGMPQMPGGLQNWDSDAD